MPLPGGRSTPEPDIEYPPNCKEIREDLPKDELIKRLRVLAREFADLAQDEHENLSSLALYLSSEFFLDHTSKDVRLLTACCIADVFRLFAPEAPYSEPDLLKDIFMFLIKQLRGLEKPSDPLFTRYFYLLENLAWVKSFNICLERLPEVEHQEIFSSLFKLIFSMVNEEHNNKVTNFMLDVMCPLLTEADNVTQPLLDTILINLIEPYKSSCKEACQLSKELIHRSCSALEPYIQQFFNNALMLGKNSQSDLSDRVYDLIYELNFVSPVILSSVLPQLEYKLRSTDADERKNVVKLLGRMFSSSEYTLAEQHKQLWTCYIGRFNDVDKGVRLLCVQNTEQFLLLQDSPLKDEIISCLEKKAVDQDEVVRHAVVKGILSVAKKDLDCVPLELILAVRQRTLDKMYKIRKEALAGLASLYKQYFTRDEMSDGVKPKVEWIENKLLHQYYQPSYEDRTLVERIFNNTLIEFKLPAEERMSKLLQLYCSIDEHAVKAINEIFRTQFFLKTHTKQLFELYEKEKTVDRAKAIAGKVLQICKFFNEPQKMQEAITQFTSMFETDKKYTSAILNVFGGDISCQKAHDLVKQILCKLQSSMEPQSPHFLLVKVLLERTVPILIDKEVFSLLTNKVQEYVIDPTLLDSGKAEKAMNLLVMLSTRYPELFHQESVLKVLVDFIKMDNTTISLLALQCLVNLGSGVGNQFPEITEEIVPHLRQLALTGTDKQAKHSIKIISLLCQNKVEIYQELLEELEDSLEWSKPNYTTAIVSIGHIANVCPRDFISKIRAIIKKNIYNDLLMQSKEEDTASPSKKAKHFNFTSDVSRECKAKMYGMKLIAQFLVGLKENVSGVGTAAIKLFFTVIQNDGDLQSDDRTSELVKAHLRLCASKCILKIAEEKAFMCLISNTEICQLALMVNDPVFEVRSIFLQKLHKRLLTLNLPMLFMAFIAYSIDDPESELKARGKQYYLENITRRRDYIAQNTFAGDNPDKFLPEYMMPYAIYLIAHDPELLGCDDIKTLIQLKRNMWFLLEPLVKSNNLDFDILYNMCEMIKVSRDAQHPHNELINEKIYCVCDMAIHLLGTRTKQSNSKHTPKPPAIKLPKKFFVEADKGFKNPKNYLPKELMDDKKAPKTMIVTSGNLSSEPLDNDKQPMSATENKPKKNDKKKATKSRKSTEDNSVKENVSKLPSKRSKNSRSKKAQEKKSLETSPIPDKKMKQTTLKTVAKGTTTTTTTTRLARGTRASRTRRKRVSHDTDDNVTDDEEERSPKRSSSSTHKQFTDRLEATPSKRRKESEDVDLSTVKKSTRVRQSPKRYSPDREYTPSPSKSLQKRPQTKTTTSGENGVQNDRKRSTPNTPIKSVPMAKKAKTINNTSTATRSKNPSESDSESSTPTKLRTSPRKVTTPVKSQRQQASPAPIVRVPRKQTTPQKTTPTKNMTSPKQSPERNSRPAVNVRIASKKGGTPVVNGISQQKQASTPNTRMMRRVPRPTRKR